MLKNRKAMPSGSSPATGLRPVKLMWSVMMQKSPTWYASLMAPAALVTTSVPMPSSCMSHTG